MDVLLVGAIDSRILGEAVLQRHKAVAGACNP